MRLSPGDRVGPYEVVAPLGAGGMGEVFRARDARLKRDVALKLLPPSAADDHDRRARFEREAQVLASLNHPAIAQIFGVEARGDASVIVMEFVDGPTLADRIARGALPIDEALTLAAQICDGLEAAHERGTVHRDLKPANIKVRPDGTIKILDFGLARVLTEDAAADAANSPTVLGGRTEMGLVLGTAAYMSPEQARGRTVDKRTDIWAFGCILYEMLSGDAPFAGESTTDILAAVVQREPDWSRLPGGVPAKIEELLRRCLQKSARDRLRDAGDVRFEIEQALRAPASPPASSARALPVAGSAPTRASRSPLLWFLFGGVAAAAVALVAAWLLRGRAAAPAPALRAVIALPRDTTVALSRGSAVALSPDGRRLVVAARQQGKVQLYVRPLDRYEFQPLPGTDDAANPFFSPDGQWVGFFADGKLKKVSLDGGAPVAIADVRVPRGEAWAADNSIFVTPTGGAPVSRISAQGGKLEPVTSLRQGELSHRWPRVLPDGSAVIYTIWNDVGWEPSRLAVQPLKGGEPKVIVESGGAYPRYIRDPENGRAYLVYARLEGLLAAVFDESRLALAGQAIPVVDGVITNLSGGAHFDLSATGTLAYVPGALGEADRDLSWVTADGKATKVLTVRGMSRLWMLSPDGTRVVRNATVGPNRDIWVEDLARATSARLTNVSDSFGAIFSKDGRWVAFAGGVPTANLYRVRADGSAAPERLTTGPRDMLPGSFSPDGALLAYSQVDPVSGSDIWITSVPANGTEPRPFVRSNFGEGNPEFSPDGRWIAYQSNESGRFEIFVRSFPDGTQTSRISTDGGLWPKWSSTGREIFYRGLNNKMMAAPVTLGAEPQIGRPRVLFDATSYEVPYGVAPDNARFLMMPLISTEQSATAINVVFNFLSELRQRVR